MLWFELFPNATLENLVAPTLDHYPIMLNRTPVVRPHLTKRNFRFENAWKLEPGFNKMVKECWHTYSEAFLLPRQHRCAEEMVEWSKHNCKKLKLEIEECRHKLNLARSSCTSEEQLQLTVLHKRMNRLLAQDDAYWRQRAKTH